MGKLNFILWHFNQHIYRIGDVIAFNIFEVLEKYFFYVIIDDLNYPLVQKSLRLMSDYVRFAVYINYINNLLFAIRIRLMSYMAGWNYQVRICLSFMFNLPTKWFSTKSKQITTNRLICVGSYIELHYMMNRK